LRRGRSTGLVIPIGLLEALACGALLVCFSSRSSRLWIFVVVLLEAPRNTLGLASLYSFDILFS
ncbi:MAG: hypothetical protein QW250_06340, partial [Sulfolobaceae archaeon]